MYFTYHNGTGNFFFVELEDFPPTIVKKVLRPWISLTRLSKQFRDDCVHPRLTENYGGAPKGKSFSEVIKAALTAFSIPCRFSFRIVKQQWIGARLGLCDGWAAKPHLFYTAIPRK
ncbi:hypothetical protein TNCV_4972271 [Trichonephila clavipes]|nr:hypothetical protein TNCV_4972271 [Trichonephila clavipes]